MPQSREPVFRTREKMCPSLTLDSMGNHISLALRVIEALSVVRVDSESVAVDVPVSGKLVRTLGCSEHEVRFYYRRCHQLIG